MTKERKWGAGTLTMVGLVAFGAGTYFGFKIGKSSHGIMKKTSAEKRSRINNRAPMQPLSALCYYPEQENNNENHVTEYKPCLRSYETLDSLSVRFKRLSCGHLVGEDCINMADETAESNQPPERTLCPICRTQFNPIKVEPTCI